MTDLKNGREVNIVGPRLPRSPSLPKLPIKPAGNTRIPTFGHHRIEDEALAMEMMEEAEVIRWNGPSSNTKPTSPPLSTDDDRSDFFFVDTTPDTTNDLPPTYDSLSLAPLGTVKAMDQAPDEQIIFAPKTYRQPEPILVQNVKQAPPPIPESLEPQPELPSRVFLNPRAMSRAEKKSAKKQKKKRNKGKGKMGKQREERIDDDGSDLERGSDGPPPKILAVEGLRLGKHERDVEILRDYLEGTLLNAKMEEEDEEEERRKAAAQDNAEMMEVEEDRHGDKAQLGVTENLGDAESRINGEKEVVREDTEVETEVDDEDVSIDDPVDATDDSETGGSAAGVGEADGVEDQSGSKSESESESGSSSSDLGNLDNLDEFDSEEEEEFFNGKQSWGNETDWFIRNMEVSFVRSAG